MAIPILYLIDYLSMFSGTERHLCELLQRLDRKTFQPYVATFVGSEELKRKVEDAGVPLRILNISRIYGVRQAKVFMELRRFIKTRGIRIVQTFHTKPDLFGTALARVSGVPVIVSSRRDMAFDRTRRELCLYKLLNRYVDGIICVSRQVRELVREEEGIDGRKLNVIYNGIETANFRRGIDARAERKKLGIRPEQRVVGMLANFNAIKGHRYFLDACPQIRRQAGEALFLLAGKGPEEEAMRRHAAALGLGSCVRFLGYRTDTPEILAVMDVLVAPSLSEGFSNTLLEALYMGKPVVATRVGGNPEIIMDGITGLLVPPADATAIARGVAHLLNDPALAARLGKNGRKRVEDQHLIGDMVARTEALYRRLLLAKGVRW